MRHHPLHLCKHGAPITAGCTMCKKDHDAARLDGVESARKKIGIDACPHSRGSQLFHAWCDGHRSWSEKK